MWLMWAPKTLWFQEQEEIRLKALPANDSLLQKTNDTRSWRRTRVGFGAKRPPYWRKDVGLDPIQPQPNTVSIPHQNHTHLHLIRPPRKRWEGGKGGGN